jgi:predicted acylesterase/phospholipase RssA
LHLSRVIGRFLGPSTIVVLGALVLAGCGVAGMRNPVPTAELAARAEVPGLGDIRFYADEVSADVARDVARRLPYFAAAARAAGPRRQTVDYLALSGGGADGAFGAGLLAGWSQRGTRPDFRIVTGVSAGGIIAPFAFLGRGYDRKLREIWTQYSTNELIVPQILSGVLGGSSLADTGPLKALIADYIDARILRAIAAEYRKGRLLFIGTTNLDAQRPVIWNMGAIAAAGDERALALFRDIILASAAIPGAFPPVNIKVSADGQSYEEMHVDGGVMREVFIGPIQSDLRAFDRLYATPPQRRIYVVKNGKITPEYEPVKPTTISIAVRAIFTLTKSQNQSDIYRIWRRARDAGADFNLVAVPANFAVRQTQAFDPAYQQRLYQEGFRVGFTGASWRKAPPVLATPRTDHRDSARPSR